MKFAGKVSGFIRLAEKMTLITADENIAHYEVSKIR